MALRSEILGTVSEFTVEQVEGKVGRDDLANNIKDAINTRLEQLRVLEVLKAYSLHLLSFNRRRYFAKWLDLENYQTRKWKLF